MLLEIDCLFPLGLRSTRRFVSSLNGRILEVYKVKILCRQGLGMVFARIRLRVKVESGVLEYKAVAKGHDEMRKPKQTIKKAVQKVI